MWCIGRHPRAHFFPSPFSCALHHSSEVLESSIADLDFRDQYWEKDPMRLLTRIAAVVILFWLPSLTFADPAPQANPMALGNPAIYEKSAAALTQLFVIAVLLESAFTVLFTWRVFLIYFNRSGVKTLVMVSASVVVVHVFDVDILASLLAVYKGSSVASGPLSKFITALILAGGSAGVNNVMRALGYRSKASDQALGERPPRDKSWLAVRVRRVRAVTVLPLGSLSAFAGAGHPAPAPIAGTIAFARNSVSDLMLRRVDRFPQSGGHELQPDTVYQVAVVGVDAQGQEITTSLRPMVFAPGAIVDISIDL
jgi:hypothetical protein